MARKRAASVSSAASVASDVSSGADNNNDIFDKAANASSASITPATSLPDNTSEQDAPEDTKRRVSGRARNFVTSYNEAERSGTAVHRRKSLPAKLASGSNTRNVSAATTLVERDSPSRQLLQESVKVLDLEWDLNKKKAGSAVASPNKMQRRQSTRRQLENVATSVAGALTTATSALGKRSRDAIETARDTLRGAPAERGRETRSKVVPASKSAKQDDDAMDAATNALSAKLSAFPGLQARMLQKEKEQKKIEEEKARLKAPRTIKSVDRGLYYGMQRNFHAVDSDGKVKGKGKKKEDDYFGELDNTWLPLPMAAGERLFREGRDFKLPFNILNPLPTNEAPKDWKTLNKNRFIGDAGPTWRKDLGQFERSRCSCKPGTGCSDRDGADSCVNATMHYECNADNCPFDEDVCFNRPFAELQRRARAKNEFRNPEKPEYNMFGEGVEVFKTPDRGHGVRAMRSFIPDQIIVEYCGEIITQEEGDRRMNVDYKDKHNYYLMDFHEGLIIDATRGSLCRFVNHSCEPNCRVEKWSVNGEPRMALFAERPIDVGEELTYDYNFDPFSKDNIQKCFCGTDSCRGVIGPKPKDQRSKLTKPLETALKVAKGVKRKFTKAIRGDVDSDNDEKSIRDKKRRKTLPDPRALLAKAKKQISKAPAPAPALILPDITHQEQAQSRAARAAKRISLGQPTGKRTAPAKITKRHSESTLTISKLKGSPLRATSRGNRRSTGNLLQKSPQKSLQKSPAQATKPGKSLDKLKDAVRKNVTTVLDTAKPSTAAGKLSKALKGKLDAKSNPRLSSGSNPSKGSTDSLRQSRLSFAAGNMSLRASTQSPVKQVKDKVRDGHVAKVAKSPLTRPTTSGRPMTAMSVATSVKSAAVRSVKGPRRAVAVARMGLRGDEAVRKTIRTVSGAD